MSGEGRRTLRPGSWSAVRRLLLGCAVRVALCGRPRVAPCSARANRGRRVGRRFARDARAPAARQLNRALAFTRSDSRRTALPHCSFHAKAATSTRFAPSAEAALTKPRESAARDGRCPRPPAAMKRTLDSPPTVNAVVHPVKTGQISHVARCVEKPRAYQLRVRRRQMSAVPFRSPIVRPYCASSEGTSRFPPPSTLAFLLDQPFQTR